MEWKLLNHKTTFTYTQQQVSTLLFDNKLYHMPIPYDETVKNRALTKTKAGNFQHKRSLKK